MEPLIEYRLRLAGYETRALELEGRAGPPLLLVHGWADSADTWRVLLDRLARAERRALALDLPGFATADALGPGAMLPQLDAFVDEALAYLLDESGAERAIVVGNSLGGCLSMRLAERASDRLAGIVPIAPAGLTMPRWFTLIEHDPLIRALLALPVVPRRVLASAVARLYMTLGFAHPERIDPQIVRMFAEHLSARAPAQRVMAHARRLLPELRDPFELERIACPLLLVWGERDRMVYPVGAERVLAAVQGSRLELFADCGHLPQIEHVDRVASLVLGFPADLARAA